MNGSGRPAAIAPRPQLMTYPDSLGGDLRAIADQLDGPLAGLFHGVHILPPFPSSGDRGFAPLTYREIDPRFGSWDDIRRIGARHDVVLDLMVNHLSRRSAEFRAFERRGRHAPEADLFLTLDKVWPDGAPPAADVARIFLRKPDAPFSTITIEETGEEERVWTSFGSAGWSEQIDLDVRSPATRRLIEGWLAFFASQRVRVVRLDAVGYVIKRAGTSCFMVEPEIWSFLEWIDSVAASHGLVVLPEVHDHEATHRQLTKHRFWTYDFVLPGLLLNAFDTADATRLAAHLAESPDRQFTMLDCHDGIPVRPDLDGILTPAEMRRLADGVRARGGNVNRILSTAHAGDVDVHQLNATYHAALGCDDDRTVAARAIQLFARGVPQIYYGGLLAADNDADAVRTTGDGRAVNRHDFTPREIAAALDRPVVRRLIEITRLRNNHAAFDGRLDTVSADGSTLEIGWRNGDETLMLEADLATGRALIRDGSVPPRAL
jgi:sucrose phosphorylase